MSAAAIPSRRVPLLAASAVASGASALAFQLLWGRELALTFGSSQYAVAAVLAGFMLGLGLGSWLGGRLADRSTSPARTLAAVEALLAVAGPLLSLALLHLPRLAASVLPPPGSIDRPGALLPRFLLSLIALLPATVLMGATFPLLARAGGCDVPGLHRAVPVLYGANTAGGVIGVLAAGFALLPTLGVPGVIVAAACANLTAAALALAAAQPRRSRDVGSDNFGATHRAPLPLLLAALASGTLVFASETVWHRALQITSANSTYTLTLLLAVFLVGLAGGGFLARPLMRSRSSLGTWAVLQAVAACILLLGLPLLGHLPEVVRSVRPAVGWERVLAVPVGVGAMVLLPLALVLGAAWPLLLAAATPRLEDGGRLIGAMAFVNSIGAALGATVAGWWLLPHLGFGHAVVALAAAHLALAAFGAVLIARRTPALALVLVTVMLLLGAAVAPRFGRVLMPSTTDGPSAGQEVLLYRESPVGTVTVLESSDGRFRSMYVDSSAVIGTTYDALKVTRMLGVLPPLLHDEPRRGLVVGFGAGVTTAMLAGFPQLEDIEVVEIVPAVVEAAELFGMVNHRVLARPGVRLVLNDGRNHLLLTERTYDVITCDPVHPLLGSAPLYSLEFFELCRKRLAPGGIVSQYLPLHDMPPDAFRRTIATFRAAFPETWVAFSLGHGVLIGSTTPIELDWQAWQRLLATHRHPHDLRDSALDTPGQIAALFQLDPDACRTVGSGPPSTDLHPRLEFLAPAAYEPGVWETNAKTLVQAYTSPLKRIDGLPAETLPAVRRLIAGKRLLLFSMLRHRAGDPTGAGTWARRALQVAGDDPEVRRWAAHLRREAEVSASP